MKPDFKIIISCFFAALLVLFTGGCDMGDFGDTNENPNATTVPITSALLTNALTNTNSTFVIEGLYSQYLSESQYTDLSRYSRREYGFWDYSGVLYDLENIIIQNTDEETKEDVLNFGSNNNQIAIARILKVFFFSRITDMLGDVPYFEALKGDPSPAYDLQEEIYPDFFKELDEAVKQFDGGLSAQGDILFLGNKDRWKRFANSLRLMLALRVSEAAPDLGRTQALAALSADGGVMENNRDNAVLNYPGDDFRNPWFSTYDGRKDYAISEILVQYLQGLEDPRLVVYGSPDIDGEVTGIPYGLPRENALEFTGQHPNWSFALAPQWRQQDSPLAVLTAGDVYLARAEAAALSWTSESVMEMYEAGIQASMEYWGVYDPGAFEKYMGQPGVAISNGAGLDKVRFQRWLSFFPNGYLGWTLWRRTGVPDLQPTPYAVNTSGEIPRRYVYWSREANLNPENYQAAVDRMGGEDTMDGRVWWDRP